MRSLPRRNPGKTLVPWSRRYPVPLGGAQLGSGGHVDDHNAIASQLPELWERVERLHDQAGAMATLIFWLAIAVVILGILVGLLIFHVI